MLFEIVLNIKYKCIYVNFFDGFSVLIIIIKLRCNISFEELID